MKLPRDLSGAELVKALCRHFGYRQINQEGSHSPLRLGTLNAILNAVARAQGVDKRDILERL